MLSDSIKVVDEAVLRSVRQIVGGLVSRSVYSVAVEFRAGKRR